MGICSVVITMDTTDDDSVPVLQRLAADSRWTLGVWRRGTLAAVLETHSATEDRRCLRWLDEQPGVAAVHLVFAHYGDASDDAGATETPSGCAPRLEDGPGPHLPAVPRGAEDEP